MKQKWSKVVLAALVASLLSGCGSINTDDDINRPVIEQETVESKVTEKKEGGNNTEKKVVENTVPEKVSNTKEETVIETEISSEEESETHAHAYVSKILREASCVEYGTEELTCECGYSYVQEILMKPHVAGEWTVVEESTYDKEGMRAQFCIGCNSILATEPIEKAECEHDYKIVESVSSTCTQKGVTTYECNNCDSTYSVEQEAKGHAWNNGEITTAPTCTSSGTKTYICEICQETKSEELQTLEHDYELTDAATPTCISADDNVYKCTVCGHEKTESVDALGHTAGEWITKEPTFTEAGMKAQYCVSCGVKVSEEELDVLPHECSYTEFISRTPATCTEKGMIVEACNICRERLETEIPSTGHTDGEWKTETPATCTVDGLKVQKCSVCEATVNSEAIPATGHSPGEWETEDAATCSADGLEIQKCTICGTTVNSETTPATGHSLGGWITTNEAGCETDGTETKSCSACDYSESRSIPATGHSYGDWIVDVEPTEENEGSKHKECSKCNNVITEDIEQLPPHVHNYTETTRTESTCSAAGSITYSCECGDSYSEEIGKINHSEGDWETASDATCTADGSKVKKCTSCGTTLRTETIEKIAHVYSETATVAATCTADGYTRYKCNSCDSTYDTVLPATGHDYGEAIIEEGTCTNTGSIKYVCEICGHENITETSALGHNYVVTNTMNPTCTTAGKTVYTCNRNGCNASYEEEIPMIEHVYNTTTVEATCETDGYTIKTCENCEDEIIETQEGSATGHTAGDWVVTLQPTYTEKGSKTKACVNCSEILETEEIPVLELPNGDAVYTIKLKGGATTTVMGHYDEGLAADLVDLVNAYRAENDLPTLTVTDYMSECAAIRGYETSHTWDHLKPNGGSAIASYGYSAENLAWYITRTTAQEIFDALRDCEDHNAIMLSSFTYNETAVSVFCKYVGEINGQPDYEYYWVQIFD